MSNSRGRRFRRFVCLPTVFALALGTGCSRGNEAATTPTAPRAYCTVEGKVFLVGVLGQSRQLFRLDLCPFGARRVTEYAGVSAVAANPGRLVVSGALAVNRQGAGVAEIRELKGSKFTPVTGIGSVDGFSPSLDPAGGLAFVRRASKAGQSNDVVLYRDGVVRVVTRGSDFDADDGIGERDQPDVDGPNLAVVENTSPNRNVEMYDVSDDSARRVWTTSSRLPYISPLSTSTRRGLVAAALPFDEGTATELFDLSGRSVFYTKAWRALDFSPSGEFLLVSAGRRVGLVPTTTSSSSPAFAVTWIGRVDFDLSDAAWAS